MNHLVKGALTAVISSLLAAILFAYVFRFPIPMAGMLGPLGSMNPYDRSVVDVIAAVAVGWFFYGILGGFVVVPAFGFIAAVIAEAKFANSKNRNRMLLCWSSIAGAIPRPVHLNLGLLDRSMVKTHRLIQESRSL